MARFGERSFARGFLPLTAAIALLHAGAADAAQAPPTSGEVLKELQDKPQAAPPTKPPSIEVPPEKRRAVKPVPGLKVDVKAFRFSGLTIVREADLQAQVQSFIGPGKSFDDLQAAADAVSEYLQRRGYIVAQAYLPEQKIEGGVVEIAVLEGRLAQVRLEIDDNVRVSRPVVEGLLSPLAPGTVMHRDTIERALFLVSDLRGVNVRSIVEPGSEPGTSNLIVKLSAGRLADGVVELDNYGSRYTGDWRLGGGLNINSPLRRGDLLSFRVLGAVPGGAENIDFGRVSYLSPLGSYGTKLGLAYSALTYHLGTATFEPLDQHGRADVASVFGLHPFVRTRNFNLFGQAGFDWRDFHDTIGAVGISSDKRTKVGTVGLVGDARDAYLGGGINNFALSYTTGRLDIQTPTLLAADQLAGHHTNGTYSRVNGSVSRMNALAKSTIVFVSYQFQAASKNLDVSEKLGLGGPFAVRAYAVGEATSDIAHIATAELRMDLPRPSVMPGNLVGSLFYDYAYGRQQKDPLPFESATNSRTLSGIGLGLTWARQDDFSVRSMLAWRLSGSPVSDPKDRRPRIFVQLQKSL